MFKNGIGLNITLSQYAFLVKILLVLGRVHSSKGQSVSWWLCTASEIEYCSRNHQHQHFGFYAPTLGEKINNPFSLENLPNLTNDLLRDNLSKPEKFDIFSRPIGSLIFSPKGRFSDCIVK